MKRFAVAFLAISTLAHAATELNVLTNEIEMKPNSSYQHFRVINVAGDPGFIPSSDYYGVLGKSGAALWTVQSYYLLCNILSESSDERLKENIVDLNADVLTKIKNLRPVSYNKITEDTTSRNYYGREIGFLAQNVQQYFPEIVTQDAETGYYAVQYSRAVPILLKAIQEQQKIIEQQTQILQQQAAQISQIQAALGM
jgi:hypothetical protein